MATDDSVIGNVSIFLLLNLLINRLIDSLAYLFIYLLIYLLIYLSIYFCLSVYLSVCLSSLLSSFFSGCHIFETCISLLPAGRSTPFYLKHHWGGEKAAIGFGPDCIKLRFPWQRIAPIDLQ